MTINTTADEDKDAYVFNRDLLASSRLHLQHKLWIASVGHLLHPSIPLKENTLIADIGCGTGIWCLEAAKQLPPGGRIDGYDLNLAQTPPKGWWPDNVTFGELDIFKPLPQQLTGKYDVVCIRHFICIVQSGDPMPLLSALLQLLKPGGYLQWQEWDLLTNQLVVAETTGSAATVAPKFQAFMDSIKGQGQLEAQASWVQKFDSRFSDAGAELIAHDRHWTAKENAMLKQEISFLGAREWCENQRARNPASPEAAKLQKLTDDAQEECWRLQRGSMIDTEMVTWVARKK